METIIATIKEQISNGAKFNGTVYGKQSGKAWIVLHVYLDNNYTKIACVPKEDAEAMKAEILAEIGAVNNITSNKTQWLVDGKAVQNNLTYAQMYDRYGMDFE